MHYPVILFGLVLAPLFSTTLAHAAESIPGVDSFYEDVRVSDGATLQTIVTLPHGDPTPRHPLLFTQWVSCGGLEYRPGPNPLEILAALARESGLALVRVERSARKDGPSCDALDFETELSHYHEAFSALLKSPRIDARRVFLYGSSLGANTAPLLATRLQRDGYDVAGVIVQGGGALTYYERMLSFDRHYLERRPAEVAAGEVHAQMLDRAEFQYEYLVAGRHPDEIAEDSPAMQAVRRDTLGLDDDNQYGRPFAWHQQMAKQNFLAAWANTEAPVLVIFNEFDQFESRRGHALIAETVNRLRPGTATFFERRQIGHSDNRYATIEDAYAFEGGAKAWQGAADIMLNWLDRLDVEPSPDSVTDD